MLESQYDFKTRGLQSVQKLILTFDAFSSPNTYKSTLSNSKNKILFLQSTSSVSTIKIKIVLPNLKLQYTLNLQISQALKL